MTTIKTIGENDLLSDSRQDINDNFQALNDGKSEAGHGHIATDVTQDATHRFATDAEKSAWNAHKNAAHAPANAQKNDKSNFEVEADTLVKRNAYGYIKANYIDMTADIFAAADATLANICCSHDNYIRKMTPLEFKKALGLNTTVADLQAMMDSKVSAVLESAPETLNTLNELAAALGDDPNFATSVSTELGTKLGKSEKAADSAKLQGLVPLAASTPNSIVARDVKGDIYARYLNLNAGNEVYPISAVFYETGSDGYLRKGSLSHLKDSLGTMNNSAELGGIAASGYARKNHYHDFLLANDKRDVKPNTTGIGKSSNNYTAAIKPFFTTLAGMTGSADTTYQDLLVMDTYYDPSGGSANALTFSKTGDQRIRHWRAQQTADTWGTPKLLAYTTDKAPDSSKLNGQTLAQVRAGVSKANVGLSNVGNHVVNQDVAVTSSPQFNEPTVTNLMVKAGVGSGVFFWGSAEYKIHMGNDAEYHYGPVTDYSIKTNMNGQAGRGWTWGGPGGVPVAAIEATKGDMQIKGNFHAATITEGHVNLADKYLGKAAKAADSDKLDGMHIEDFHTAINHGPNTQDPNIASYTQILSNHANTPGTDSSVYWHITTTFYSLRSGSANRGQIAVDYNGSGKMYVRSYHNSTNWSPWVRCDNNGKTADSLKLGGLEKAAAATPDTVVARDASGYIHGRYFNQNSAKESLAMSSIFYEYNNDGYLRKGSLAHVRSGLQDSTHRFVTDAEKATWNEGCVPYEHPATHDESEIVHSGMIPTPGGAAYRSTSKTQTGLLKITLPQSWSNTMLSFTVRVFDYAQDASFVLHVNGYNNSSSGWINTTATMVGPKANHTVKFGDDGSKCCIYIGEVDTVWNYPQVVVSDFFGGYSQYDFDRWNDGWSIGFTTAPKTIHKTHANPNTALWK